MDLPLNSRGAEAAKRLANEMLRKHKELFDKCHTIAILARKENNEDVFQWGDNTGQWYSPRFTDIEEAFSYPTKHGLKPYDMNTDGLAS